MLAFNIHIEVEEQGRRVGHDNPWWQLNDALSLVEDQPALRLMIEVVCEEISNIAF